MAEIQDGPKGSAPVDAGWVGEVKFRLRRMWSLLYQLNASESTDRMYRWSSLLEAWRKDYEIVCNLVLERSLLLQRKRPGNPEMISEFAVFATEEIVREYLTEIQMWTTDEENWYSKTLYEWNRKARTKAGLHPDFLRRKIIGRTAKASGLSPAELTEIDPSELPDA